MSIQQVVKRVVVELETFRGIVPFGVVGTAARMFHKLPHIVHRMKPMPVVSLWVA